MMNSSMVHKVALFYFFAFLDERQAILATKKVIQKISKDTSLQNLPNDYFEKNPSAVIHEIERVWRRFKERRNLSFTNFDLEAGWILPEELNIGLWRQFLKDASSNELIVVIFSQILKFSDKEVSKGLGLTVGTVRMRSSQALRKLGALRI